ncbi:MAG: NAD(P)H-dependent oxidoreductase [Rhodospirillales bacterium]|nr:NAD(P)H-dependent oxidoreductase [Rhodospirillales bacterium]
MTTRTLLIVGHVPSPNTQRLRDRVEAGAVSLESGAVNVRALSPFDTHSPDVLAADAIVLGTTENLGYMSGAMKDFFDRCYDPVLEKKQGLPYALYIRAGLDGTGTRRAVESIATGLRWRAVNEPLLLKGEWQDGFADRAGELGMLMAAGLEAGVF